MTLSPAAVLSPSMMKLSGTTMLEDTVPGMAWPVVLVVDARDRLGQIEGGVLDRGRRAVLARVAEHVEARAAAWRPIASPNWSWMSGPSWIV